MCVPASVPLPPCSRGLPRGRATPAPATASGAATRSRRAGGRGRCPVASRAEATDERAPGSPRRRPPARGERRRGWSRWPRRRRTGRSSPMGRRPLQVCSDSIISSTSNSGSAILGTNLQKKKLGTVKRFFSLRVISVVNCHFLQKKLELLRPLVKSITETLNFETLKTPDLPKPRQCAQETNSEF